MKAFHSLNWSPAAGWLPLPAQPGRTPLGLDGPALDILEDFTQHVPSRLPATTEARAARAFLEAAQERWSCVVNNADELVGIITLRDLYSHHSAQRARQLQMTWDEVPVQYLMTALTAMPLVPLERLRKARVGDVAATLRESGCDFLLVAQDDRLRGVISTGTLRERTGEPLRVHHHPSSFADIVQAVNHPDESA